MKRPIFTIVFLLLSGLIAFGQEEMQPITSHSSLELNFARSLWFNSPNAAGLAVNPLDNYNILSATYNLISGDYKLQQHGDSEKRMKFNTNGALKTGKVFLWGEFTFSNDFVTGSTYNTNLYETYTDMPYYGADPNNSDWNKQFYDMSVKAAVFIWNGRLALGGGLNYFTKKGAKQLDPRSVVLNYGIKVEPSVVLKIASQQRLGITLLYQNTFDRNTFTNSNSAMYQTVQLMRGLGNFSSAVIGGNTGVKPYYYPGNQYGGSVQYAFSKEELNALLNLTYSTQTINVFEEPSKPRRRGSTEKKKTGANLQLVKTGNTTHKLTLDFCQFDVDGIEYVQELNNDSRVQQWITIAQYVKSQYKYREVSLNYDLFWGVANDYSWRTGLNVVYSDKQDEYLMPNSWFNAKKIYTKIYAKKNLAVFSSSKILVGLDWAYNRNLDGKYVYNGSDPESLIVTDFYAKDLAYLTSNYLQTGCSLDWSFLLHSKSSININANWQWAKVVGEDLNRSRFEAAVAYIF